VDTSLRVNKKAIIPQATGQTMQRFDFYLHNVRKKRASLKKGKRWGNEVRKSPHAKFARMGPGLRTLRREGSLLSTSNKKKFSPSAIRKITKREDLDDRSLAGRDLEGERGDYPTGGGSFK